MKIIWLMSLFLLVSSDLYGSDRDTDGSPGDIELITNADSDSVPPSTLATTPAFSVRPRERMNAHEMRNIALEWFRLASPNTLRTCPPIMNFVNEEIKDLHDQGLIYTADSMRSMAAADVLMTEQQQAKFTNIMSQLNKEIKTTQKAAAQERARANRLEQEMQDLQMHRQSSYVQRDLPSDQRIELEVMSAQQKLSCVQKHPIRSVIAGTLVGLGVGCVATSLVILGKIY